jgi:hypothetical protein
LWKGLHQAKTGATSPHLEELAAHLLQLVEERAG